MDSLDFKNLTFDNEKKEYKEEPILVPNTKRFVLFPIEYTDIWQQYKNLESRFWTAEDVELGNDGTGFESLHGKAKSHLLQCLALLTMDLQDQPQLASRLAEIITVPEARCFYGFQMMQSNVHAELISVLMECLASEEYRHDTIDIVSKCMRS
jgi:ribonucleoside-diphosphate reductase subunit M2